MYPTRFVNRRCLLKSLGSKILNLLCCLWDQNFSILSWVPGGSEILNPLLCCLGGHKFWISCVVWGIRISQYSPVYLRDQKFRIPSARLCYLGYQKFWISCVWGSEIRNPLLCSRGIRNSECSPVFLGAEILNALLCYLGDQKFWILSSLTCVFVGDEI